MATTKFYSKLEGALHAHILTLTGSLQLTSDQILKGVSKAEAAGDRIVAELEEVGKEWPIEGSGIYECECRYHIITQFDTESDSDEDHDERVGIVMDSIKDPDFRESVSNESQDPEVGLHVHRFQWVGAVISRDDTKWTTTLRFNLYAQFRSFN